MRTQSKTLLVPKPDIPSLSDAEEWLSPFVFVYKGKTWEEKPNGEIVRVKAPAEPGSTI